MSISRGSWTHAEEDNNCAFNAFILGLAQLVLDDEITDANATPGLKDLLKKIPFAPTIAAFKKYLQNNTPYDIQKDLQQIFREFTIDEVCKKDKTIIVNNEGLILDLQSAFRDHILGLRGSDSFPVSVIKDKFEEMSVEDFKEIRKHYPNPLVDKNDKKKYEEEIDKAIEKLKINEALSTWWKQENGGADKFLNKMRASGTWGGDMELKGLANKLDIGIKLDAKDREASHLNYGYLIVGAEGKEATQRLIDCGYLDKNTQQWNKMVSKKDVESALDPVSELDKVEPFIVANNTKLKSVDVPPAWSQTCKDQLVLRRILRKDEAGYQFNFNEVKEMDRLKAVPEPAKVAVLDEFAKNPPKEPVHISLVNVGRHWNNNKPPKEAKPEITAKVPTIKEIEKNIMKRNANVKNIVSTLFVMSSKGELDAGVAATKVERREGEKDDKFAEREKQIQQDEALARELQKKELEQAIKEEQDRLSRPHRPK